MTVITLTILVILLAIGIPVAFVFATVGLGLFIYDDISLMNIPITLYSTADNFILLSIPLFLLMSNILIRGELGADLYRAVQSWIGHWPGGLAMATILSCGIFSAISGSSVATSATIGNIAFQEMITRGYERRFVLGLLAAGGTLGILIPPSIPLIIYGIITESSILDLFLAGIGPGILLITLFMLYCFCWAKFNHQYAPSLKASWHERMICSVKALPTLLLIFIIIGGIYTGVCTPTESAAVGVTTSLLIVLLKRTLSWDAMKYAVMDTLKTTVSVFFIIAGAKIFSKAITFYDIPQSISLTLTESFSTPPALILSICFSLLIIGLFLESISMLLLMMPVLLPTIQLMGIDIIWFAILFVMMIECALVTPPVGLNLFTIQAVTGSPIIDITKGVTPFFILILLAVLIIYLLPEIALFIPYHYTG